MFRLEDVEAALAQAQEAVVKLKAARSALEAKRSGEKSAKAGMKALTAATVAMFGDEAKTPIFPAHLAEVAKYGRVKLIVGIPFGELACISQDGTDDGLNDWVDDEVGHGACFTDMRYSAVGVDHENDRVLFQVDAEVPD